MKILGFNITRAGSSQKPNGTAQKSFNPAEWLVGNDCPADGPVLANAYEQVVWVYRAINAIAEQIANIPFVFSGGERGREHLITSGPLLDFYSRPHPHINRFQYWELRVLWLMLRGECFRVPIYDGGLTAAYKNPNSRIKHVLLLDPDHFHAVIQDHQLLGWRYNGFGPSTPIDSQVFLPEEIWFEKLPNPFDFWRGLSPLRVAGLAARTDFAAAAFMSGFMENNADNGLIVRTDQQLSDEQRHQIAAALRSRKRRAGTADRSILLWGASEIIKPQLSSADLQFLDNRKFSRAEICAAFGVPEEIVASTDHNKYDVMEGARLNFIENRVAPLCARLEAEENATTIPALLDPARHPRHSSPAPAVGWFDLDSLPIMQAVRRTRIATAKTAFDMGVPFNELNRVLDLGFKPLPWGDSGFLPATLQKFNTPPLPLENQNSTFKILSPPNPHPSISPSALPAPPLSAGLEFPDALARLLQMLDQLQTRPGPSQ
jgi:HK97 family phage portal protein